MKHKNPFAAKFAALYASRAFRRYRRLLRRLNRHLEDRSFWQWSQKKQIALVKQIGRIRARLRTSALPVSRMIAGTALASTLLFGQAQAQIGPFQQQTGTANPLDAFAGQSFTAPTFADIDGDGDLDAFVGGTPFASYTTEARFFENTGTQQAPLMVEQTGANNPLTGISSNYILMPTFVDMDDDGDLDLFVGQAGPPNGTSGLRYFENTGDATNAVFAEQMGVNHPLDLLTGFFVNFPTFADLDDDGDFDALISVADNSTYTVTFRYFENTGTAQAAAFTEVVGLTNPFDGISSPSLLVPHLTDVDTDGDFDLFIGNYYNFYANNIGLQFFENVGNPQAGSFTEQIGANNPFTGIDLGEYGPFPSFADIDGDGDQDVFIGQYDNNTYTSSVSYYENQSATGPLAPGSIVLNELQAINAVTMPDQDGEFDGWIELHNATGGPLYLSDTYLSNNAAIPLVWDIPDTTLAANAYLIVWADTDAGQSGLHANFELTPNGGFLSLVNADSSVVDSLSYGEQYTDLTTGRFPNATGPFKYLPPTFEAMNEDFTVVATSVTINEFEADNQGGEADQDGENDPWIELSNNTGLTLPLDGLFLSDDPADPTKWQMPASDLLPSDYLTVWADEDELQTGLHANFSLNPAGGFLSLAYPGGPVLDSLTYGPQYQDISSARIPNGVGPFVPSLATFEAENVQGFDLTSGEVVINEALALNTSTQADQDGEFDDWIEVYNTGDAPLALNGLFLSVDPANPTQWRLPDTLLMADRYLMIWADADDQAGLHANFELDETNGGTLTMGYPEAASLESMTFGAQLADESYGRYPNGTGPFGGMPPTFAAENTFFTGLTGDNGPIQLSLSPNPASDRITLRLSEAADLQVQVLNVAGQVLISGQFGWRDELDLEVSDLPSGLYFLRINEQHTERFLLQR